MTIQEKLNAMLEDEANGVDEYGQLAKEVMDSDDIPIEFKGSIADMLVTMSRDEDKHFHFLKLITSMLES